MENVTKYFGPFIKDILEGKDIPISLSASLSATSSLWLYLQFNDVIISVISFFISFPILNIIIKKVYFYYIIKKGRKKILNSFSTNEISAIKFFITENSGCTLYFSNFPELTTEIKRGLDSLITRNYAEIIREPECPENIIGIYLIEEYYKLFLNYFPQKKPA